MKLWVVNQNPQRRMVLRTSQLTLKQGNVLARLRLSDPRRKKTCLISTLITSSSVFWFSWWLWQLSTLFGNLVQMSKLLMLMMLNTLLLSIPKVEPLPLAQQRCSKDISWSTLNVQSTHSHQTSNNCSNATQETRTQSFHNPTTLENNTLRVPVQF